MTPVEERARTQLVGRREQLAGLATRRRDRRLLDLLRKVDSALAALEVGEWGVCAVCREPMNAERLHDDPLVSVCLECLEPDERRSLERDLEAAARVQRSLLPARELQHDGWEMAYLWEPRGAVSGDHVDVLRPEDDREPLHVLLGDVMGKGLAASLLQAHLHALFRALAGPGGSLGDLLGRANRLFCEATAGTRYASMVAARLHSDGRVELANAGHPRPLLADARGVRPVEGAGLPLGLFAAAEYEARDLWLPPGSTLLLYTDGWTEALRGDEELGIGRAASALHRGSGLPLGELLAVCRGELERFLSGGPRGDDLTLLALRRSATVMS
jgi:phosphoserine phosphatase RsbU/P